MANFPIEGINWLEGLPDYQKELATQLLNQSSSPETAAVMWLTASSGNTDPFGGETGDQGRKIFVEMLWNEIEKLVCGDPQYTNERRQITAVQVLTPATTISIMATAIGSALGVSAAFVAPPLALLLIGIKVSTNAWCATRQQLREMNTETS